MRNGKLIAARKVLKRHGLTLPREVILELLDAAHGQPEEIYTKNDFVQFYEGMGEMNFGTVLGPTETGHGYRVKTFWEGYETRVGAGDMRGLSTVEKAKEYSRIRNGEEYARCDRGFAVFIGDTVKFQTPVRCRAGEQVFMADVGVLENINGAYLDIRVQCQCGTDDHPNGFLTERYPNEILRIVERKQEN